MMENAVPPCDTNRNEDAKTQQILNSKGLRVIRAHLGLLSIMRRTCRRNAGRNTGKGPIGL